MKLKQILAYFWKLPLSGAAYFIGLAIGGSLLAGLGFATPASPAGTDPNMIILWFLLGSMIMAFVLSFLSKNLQGNWFARALVLFFLVWGVAAVGMVLESFFFMTTGAVDSLENAAYTSLNFLLPSLFLAGMVAALFRPAESLAVGGIKAFFAKSPSGGWGLRLAGVLAAYPLTYILFGLIVQPWIADYYASGQYELTIPTWQEMVVLQIVRSVLFLGVCLPVVIRWSQTRRQLWLSLGLTFFVLTGFMAVITAYWFPWQLRLFHGLELLADALVYIGVMVALLFPADNNKNSL